MQWNDIDFRPSSHKLRQFAGMGLVILLFGIALWSGADPFDEFVVAWWIIAGAVFILGLVRPQAIRWIYVGWSMVVFPIGWLVARLVLACVFYGVITPLGLAFRLVGRDVLALRPQRDITSYWKMKSAALDAHSHFRQF